MKTLLSLTRSQERGTVLIVALIMLLLLTMLGVSAMRGTTMEERMAGNMRDQSVAFQAAEAALREGEGWLAPLAVQPSPCLTLTAGCSVFAAGVLPDLSSQTDAWWATNGQTYSGQIAEVAALPRFVREEVGFLPDNLDLNRPSTGRMVYRITARGTGQTNDSVVILQTTYAKRFN